MATSFKPDSRPRMVASWPARPDTFEYGVAALVSMMLRLSDLDSAFSRWFLKGHSKAGASRRELVIEPEPIAKAVTRNMDDGSPTRPIESLGFYFSAWNGGEGGYDLDLSAHWASTSVAVGNNVNFGLPPRFWIDPLVSVAVLELVADLWRPSWATVITTEFRHASGRNQPLPYVGNATYFGQARRLARRVRGVDVKTPPTGGRIYVFRGEPDLDTADNIRGHWRPSKRDRERIELDARREDARRRPMH